jgi:CheY-like chemotaxis protein/MinD-like ATPase involved in chromosome partitioning or flagellar assembly
MARILVVDDEADLLDMMRLVLEQRGGHQTVLSAEAEDGLAQALADLPDLIILDVMMPGMTGYEMCRRLRANPATASIPILILTARAQPMDRDAAMNAGADDYMTKPVTMSELLERVDALLAKREETAPAFAGTFVLLSLRGGVGVTSLVVNLAVVLAQTSGGAACLVDLCPSSGHVALQLGLRPEPNWSILVEAAGAGSLDAESIRACLLQHSSGLRVLASPFIPIVGDGMPQQAAQTLLRGLQQQFAVVIVDAPAMLNRMAMTALEAASAVGLVLTAESPSIQTAVGTLRALQQWSNKLYIVLNQVTPGAQVPVEALAHTLKRPVVGNIPFDPSQARALAQGTPLALSAPTAPLAQAVQSLARTFIR